MPREYGQYSVVSYVHPTRGERVNLGLLVWHPYKGHATHFVKVLSRVRTIDETADLSRVRMELDDIQGVIAEWSSEAESPLDYLGKAFQHNVVVSTPLNARVQDPEFLLERLSASLIPPEPFLRRSRKSTFRQSVATQVSSELERRGRKVYATDFNEEQALTPIDVAVWYAEDDRNVLLRTCSFASEDIAEKQMNIAKAFYAENEELARLDKYREPIINAAVQMPKPKAMSEWPEILKWLGQNTRSVVPMVDRDSLPQLLPELIS